MRSPLFSLITNIISEFIRREGAANCLIHYYLQAARLKTSYDWLWPKWKNTGAKRAYLNHTLRAKRACFSKLNEQSELISVSTNSGRHHPGCLGIFGGQNKLPRRTYWCDQNELAAKFHVMWFISLLLVSLLRYPLIYIFLLVVRVLRHILPLTTEKYSMDG